MSKYAGRYDEFIAAGFSDEIIENYIKSNDVKSGPDSRYNTPKVSHNSDVKLVSKTIAETEIYYKTKLAILGAQHNQVGYGLEKYPEPLNAKTWSVVETIDHIIGEAVDKLHYLVMLREQMVELENSHG